MKRSLFRVVCLSLLASIVLSLQAQWNRSCLRRTRGLKGFGGSSTALHINFGWFSGKEDKEREQKNGESSALSKDGRGSLGGVAGVVDSMERYKKAQRIGKMTASLVQDLSTTTVEGVSAGGKVRVIFDCRQRAVRTIFEDGYFESASASAVTSSLTTAVKDAYNKSKELMDRMTQNFYIELRDGTLDLALPENGLQESASDSTKGKTKIDRMKSSISQDLASNYVEGTAESGKVKATFDCQQRPISISIDESYFETAFLVEDVCDAVTAALQDAYMKSAERMDEKMRSLYVELGLPSN